MNPILHFISIIYLTLAYAQIFQELPCEILTSAGRCQESSISEHDFRARLAKIFMEEYNGTYVKKPSTFRMQKPEIKNEISEVENDEEIEEPILPPPPICPPIPIKEIDPITIKNLTQPLTFNQTLEIMIYSTKNTLKNGNVKVKVKKNLREIIDKIFDIFMKAVPKEIIPWEFLSVAREVNLLYLNSLADKKGNDKNNWESVIGILDTCLQNIQPFEFATQGLTVKYFKTFEEEVDILIPPMEEADILDVDLIIDVLWYVFSFSLGACYPFGSNQNPMIWAAEYYTVFVINVMDKIMAKWINEDDANLIKAGFIFGDVDLVVTLYNLRAVTFAAYMQNQILDLQVVKPIHSGNNEVENNFI